MDCKYWPANLQVPASASSANAQRAMLKHQNFTHCAQHSLCITLTVQNTHNAQHSLCATQHACTELSSISLFLVLFACCCPILSLPIGHLHQAPQSAHKHHGQQQDDEEGTVEKHHEDAHRLLELNRKLQEQKVRGQIELRWSSCNEAKLSCLVYIC